MMNEFDIEIKVTREHLDNGRALIATKCPVAIAVHDALLREFPHTFINNVRVEVTSTRIFVTMDNDVYWAEIPAVAYFIARRVDNCEPRENISPVSFPLHFVPVDKGVSKDG